MFIRATFVKGDKNNKNKNSPSEVKSEIALVLT